MSKVLQITDVVLRDAHQSLFATRMRIEDMLPMAKALDDIGYWSLESWGGATFDACIRYLGEDPWERIRRLKQAMPKTKQQMLLRGQNLLGYRHYADDIVQKFVERAYKSGIEVFRIFDAMNDIRNLKTAIKAAVDVGAHAQGTLSYTVSPVHTLDIWLDMAKQLEDLGSHSLCIKDMAGLLTPYNAYELISRLKETVDIPIAMHCHATTGLSTATYMKAIDAGIDMLDTAISSMSMTYGHSATETIVAIVKGTERDTGIDLTTLEPIAAYFREARKKYAKFEGSLKGVDARILTAQVPGGMLTNMENQLRDQNAADKLDQVLQEIPKVRKDLGYIPLVTPTSQIVGTQAVLNVLSGERYKTVTKETTGILKGEYGATLAPIDPELQQRVLKGAKIITCRPADLLAPELDKLTTEFTALAKEKDIRVAKEMIDDVLIYALFPQIGLKFLTHRDDPSAFEPAPTTEVPAQQTSTSSVTTATTTGPEAYSVQVDGQTFEVIVAPSGQLAQIQPQAQATVNTQPTPAAQTSTVNAPLSGNIFKVQVQPGQHVKAGEIVIILEAMKMETEVRTIESGTVQQIHTKEGDTVAVGDLLISLS